MKLNMKREVKIGIFAVLMLVCLYWGVNFLKGRDLFNTNNIYYATYDQVNGIQSSSAIKIKGFKVGAVSDIIYDPERSSKIVLELTIKSKFKIPVNSEARVYSDGIMGGKAIEIELGDSGEYLDNRDTIRAVMDKDFLEVAGSEFEFLKQRANELVNEITATLRALNTLLTENSANVNATMANLASISGSLDEVVGAESQNLQGIISNMNALSATLKDNASRIDHILANVDGFTDSLRRSNIPATMDNLNGSLAQLDEALKKVNDGDGTLGKLVNDPALYDSLTSASGNLSRLLEDLKAHPGRYIHISVFGGKKEK